LESYGHQVVRYCTHNDRVAGMNRLALARNTIWNSSTYQELRALIRQERPRVAHFHNIFPLVSPAAYYAAKAESVPVIQTLHNYRLLCPNAQFFRDGGVCEDCMGKVIPWPGVVHKCYRGSRAASAVVTTMLTTHRASHTWTEVVDMYVVLTEFARRKFIDGGLPARKLLVKPNFVYPDPGPGEGRGGYALFVGRLSPEKGIGTLLAAWERFDRRIPLKVVGDGPLRKQAAEATNRRPCVEYLGFRPAEEVHGLLKAASVLIFPSEWYEGFSRVVAEAFATATPIIAADIGAAAEIVHHRHTGLRFRPGDPEDLAAQARWFFSHPEERARMRREIRAEYEAKYTAEKNYRMLMEIYDSALEWKEAPA
jgi:glycosyltransferase involved in cell wall biosynthesis